VTDLFACLPRWHKSASSDMHYTTARPSRSERVGSV